jgi:hypothetical protein
MFDYLGILISVILGLGLTHLLLGCSRLIQMRDSVKIYWVQLVWCANILFLVLAIWWGMFWWKHLQVWTITMFFFLAIYAIILFLLASLLFPGEFREGFDAEEHFYRNKNWFFGTLLLAMLIDIPETTLKGVDSLRDVPPQYALFLPVSMVIAIIGLASRRRTVHAVIAVAWSLALFAYLTLSPLDRIVAS